MNGMKLRKLIPQKLYHYTLSLKKDKAALMFCLTLTYLFSLIFCSSNLTLLFCSIVYFFFLVHLAQDVFLGALIAYVVTLAFVKGKSYSILMLPSEFVHMNVMRDVVYYFPIVISDFFLWILVWARIKRWQTLRFVPRFAFQDVIFFLIVLTSFLSCIDSWHANVTFLASVQVVRLFIAYLLMSRISEKSITRQVLAAVAALVIFESIYGFIQYIHKGSFGLYIESTNMMYSYGKTAWENPELLRISGTFVDPDVYGTFLYMHALLLGAYFVLKRHSYIYDGWILFIAAVFSSIALFLSGNRVLYILHIVSVLVMLTWTHSYKSIAAYVRHKYVLFPFVGVFLCVLPYALVRMQNFFTVFSKYGSATFRTQMFEYSAKMGLSQVFGVGLGTSPYHFATKFSGVDLVFGPDYPHNIFSQVFAETGIVGLAAFVFFCYISLRPLFVKGAFQQGSYFLIASFAFLLAAQFYPLYIPLTELVGYFIVYLGLFRSESK